MLLIVKLKGGFANQCIQYMFATSIGKITGRNVYFDCSDFTCFGLLQKIKKNTVQINSLDFFTSNLSVNKINNPLFYLYYNFFKEKYNDKNSLNEILNSNKYIVYLDGYWHDSSFIEIISNSVKSNVKANIESSCLSNSISSNKNSNESTVAVHIRRGDYLLGKYVDLYGVCPKNYYNDCIESIKSQYSNDNISFIFLTDSPEWVATNFEIDAESSYSMHNKSFIEDFVVMMNCNHYIISNSSFSWLASFLGSGSSSVTYAPSQWFKNNFQESLPLSGFFIKNIKLE